MKTVVHVITRLELGGAQQNTLYCVANHDRSRYRTGLIAGRGGELDPQAETMEDARVALVPWLKHPISPLMDIVALFKMKRLLQDWKADVVHTHSSKAGVIGRLAARMAGVPSVVHTVHGWSFNATQPAPLRWFYIALEKWLARKTDHLVTVAAADRDAGLELGIGRPEQYAVIHSGIEIETFRQPKKQREAVRRDLGFDDDQIVVGAIACLKPQKAPLDFVAAARIATAKDSRLRFFIAGDGELREGVEQAVKEACLQDKVRILGWRQDVPELLAAMDLFCLTSLFEGLPRAVLQAMAAGVPVVATAVNGTPEVVVDRETGLLVEPGKPEQAAEAILELADGGQLAGRLAENASARLGKQFEIRGMVRNLDELYQGLL